MIRLMQAQASDYDEVFPLLWMAGGEVIADYIDCDDMQKAKTICERFFYDDNCQFCYKNCVVAKNNEGICGAILFYDGGRSQQYADYFSKISGKSFEPEAESGQMYIDSIAVYEQYRGQGIAKKLLNYAFDVAKKRDMPLTLIVSSQKQQAKIIYEKAGFSVGGKKYIAGYEYYKMIKLP